LNELADYSIPFEHHGLLGDCSVSVNTIAGGEAINVVPEACTTGIDIRTLPGQNHADIIHYLQKMFAKLSRNNPKFAAEISAIREMAAMETDPNCDFVKDFCSAVGAGRTTAVGFTTDGPHFAGLGAPVVVFGPGKPEVCHKPDEYIDVADLERAVEHYRNIILKFLA
jgi:succinyl-diaminopimelate desuccinylase